MPDPDKLTVGKQAIFLIHAVCDVIAIMDTLKLHLRSLYRSFCIRSYQPLLEPANHLK